jgi:hypothetical protein
MDFQPRLIRLRDAPDYLGMDRNRFNIEVRPYVTEIPVGVQGVGFDRLDLDRWFEEYKSRNGRPGHAMERRASWDKKSRQDLLKGEKSGISPRQLQVNEFEKAVEQATSRKPRHT